MNSHYSALPRTPLPRHTLTLDLASWPNNWNPPQSFLLPPASVSAVTVKIPPFWPADLQVWFAQVEAQVSTRNIASQRTKFDHVVTALAPEFATEVRDLLLQPPADTSYNVLRAELIKQTAASEQRHLRQLFTAEKLGDRTPSQLLRRLQQLLGDAAGPNPDNTFLRELFLQRLPGLVRMVLASSGDMPLEALATLADKVMEVASPAISFVNVAPLTSEVGQLRSEVAQLREMIAALKIAPSLPYRRARSRSQSTPIACPRSSSPAPLPAENPPSTCLCCYHRRLGDAARKCTSPCSWTGNGPAGC